MQDNLETGYKKLKKSAKMFAAGASILALTACGAINVAKPNLAVSIGPDASDVSVDPQTGKASTKYNRPVMIPFYYGYPYWYGPTYYWRTIIIDPGMPHSDVGCANGPVSRGRYYK
ncbi:MAG: hypothetical protein QXN71_00425 [Candidatus Aenigmatarchaeota archaeon]